MTTTTAPVMSPIPGAHRGCSRHRDRRAVVEVWSKRPSGYGGQPVHVTTYACEDCRQRIERRTR